MRSHPNAIVGGVGGGVGLGTLAVWLLNKYAHAGFNPEEGALVAGAFSTAVLFIGRNGLRGLWRIVWGGLSS